MFNGEGHRQLAEITGRKPAKRGLVSLNPSRKEGDILAPRDDFLAHTSLALSLQCLKRCTSDLGEPAPGGGDKRSEHESRFDELGYLVADRVRLAHRSLPQVLFHKNRASIRVYQF